MLRIPAAPLGKLLIKILIIHPPETAPFGQVADVTSHAPNPSGRYKVRNCRAVSDAKAPFPYVALDKGIPLRPIRPVLEYSLHVAGTPTGTTHIKIVEGNSMVFAYVEIVQGKVPVAYTSIQTVSREGSDAGAHLVGQGDKEAPIV